MVLLAHLSDLHLDGGPRAARRAAQVVAFLDGLARPVDAVLLTGDIADHGAEAEYQEALRLLGRTQRVLMCPGNHDVRGHYRTVLLGEPPSTEPVNQVHDLSGARVAMCDSSVPGRDEGYLAEETLAWLAEVLADTDPSVPVLLACHHPPVVLHNPVLDGIRQSDPEGIAGLLAEHPNVVAVLCGHAHTPAASTFAGRPLVVAPGVVSTLRLPWETDLVLDKQMPPALAFHILDDQWRLTTHYRLVPPTPASD
jgi:3',5'-cyclic AMP phosphodiesterase CpdA